VELNGIEPVTSSMPYNPLHVTIEFMSIDGDPNDPEDAESGHEGPFSTFISTLRSLSASRMTADGFCISTTRYLLKMPQWVGSTAASERGSGDANALGISSHSAFFLAQFA
jgi:hypothetical protein